MEASERCTGCGVYDPLRRKIGSVEKLFVNESHKPEYLRVRMGLFGLKSVLSLVDFVTSNDGLLTLMLK
jgi:hypothetical protein